MERKVVEIYKPRHYEVEYLNAKGFWELDRNERSSKVEQYSTLEDARSIVNHYLKQGYPKARILEVTE